ncbi:MAG: ferrous iron transporter B [Kiritimatiellaeota bacterium]|nr:ferrous iron transporter B [Kiritimatiellota bacterium]
MKRLILIGNPNVGKSAVFWRLTGIHAATSNYPGTTVSFKSGLARIGDEFFEVVDTPGAYSIDATNEAEKVAVELVETGDLFVNVIDATNLERNLLLTMQMLERGLPMVVALNMYDDARHKGIRIDVDQLSRFLRVPVIPTVGISGVGIANLAQAICELRKQVDQGVEFPRIHSHTPEERWGDIGLLTARVQSLEHRHHTFLEWLQDISLQPRTGLLFAAILLYVAFRVIRFVGEGLIGVVFDPFFHGPFLSLANHLSRVLRDDPLLHHLLIGRLVNGEIDFVQSMGMLTTGLYVPVGMVLPYVVAFYFVLAILEDVGYLPRLGVLLDGLMHRVGLHGFGVIPVLLGLGCNVPGIMATRSLETRAQRFIACTLISVGVPCVSLQAMILKVVGDFGLRYVVGVYVFLGVVVLLLGQVLKRLVRGALPELILEIPPYRLPSLKLAGLKLYHRTRGFVTEAVPLVLGGVLLVNILDYFRFFEGAAVLAAPLVTRLWGLPQEAILPIMLGFLRKDIAAGMLIPLHMSLPQLMTACVLLSLSFPCIATFTVLFTELGWRDALKSIGTMVVTAVVFGTVARFLFALGVG